MLTDLLFEPGIHEGIPASTYHAAPFVSNSALKAFRKDGPRKWQWKRTHPTPEKPTPAKIMGTLFHTVVFEPGLFGEGVSHYVKPTTYPAPATHAKVKSGLLKAGHPLPWNGNASYCKEWEESHTDLPAISQEQEDNLRGAAAALAEDEMVGGMLGATSAREVTVMAKHPRTGLLLKMRADLMTQDKDGRPWLLDAKSIDDLDDFPWHARDFGYDTQQTFYRDVLALVDRHDAGFVFAVIELEPPFEMRVEIFDATTEEAARALYEEDLSRLADCEKTGIWPRKYPGVGRLKIPRRFNSDREDAFE